MKNRPVTARRSSPMRRRRRGITLIHWICAFFISTSILAMVVPLSIAAQRHADASISRARMLATAREVAARFRQDVRQAARVTELAGETLRLELSRSGGGDPVTVLYRRTPTGLRREVTAGGRLTERQEYTQPAAAVTFGRSGRLITATLVMVATRNGRRMEVRQELSATPRSGA